MATTAKDVNHVERVSEVEGERAATGPLATDAAPEVARPDRPQGLRKPPEDFMTTSGAVMQEIYTPDDLARPDRGVFRRLLVVRGGAPVEQCLGAERRPGDDEPGLQELPPDDRI